MLQRPPPLALGLDPFGNRLDAQASHQIEQPGNHLPFVRVVVDATYELYIEFYVLRAQLWEQAQGIIPAAQVIEGNFEAFCLEEGNYVQKVSSIFLGGLDHLEDHLVGLEAGILEGAQSAAERTPRIADSRWIVVDEKLGAKVVLRCAAYSHQAGGLVEL